MAPSAAQGGAQAIEDAWVLAAALADSADSAAWRSPLCAARATARRSAWLAKLRRNLAIYDMGRIARVARNVVLASFAGQFCFSRLDWLFGGEPE